MSQQPRIDSERQFLETCLKLKLLDDTSVQSLGTSIGQDGNVIAQIAVQRGLLTPADVDIVYSLQHPLEVVPGYEILELVGRGGMGVVYRAIQLDLEKTVALKTILIGNVHNATVVARFEREAKSLAQLQHPNIVQALNFGRHEGRYYFAMEFVRGLTCEQAVRDRGPMPPAEVWSIARQVGSGLLHAFGNNLIHRDIKPANLILLPSPEGSVRGSEVVKIADFGLAIFTDQDADHFKLTTGDKIIGSPAYMSPEQFRGQDVDFHTDMYSLGATIWHLLFGTAPFQGASVAALFQQKSERLTVDPSTLPVVLPDDQMQLLLNLLDPDPSQRPPTYQHFIDAIDALGVFASDAPQAVSGKIPVDAPQRVSAKKSSSLGLESTSDDVPSRQVPPSAELGGSIAKTIELSKFTLTSRVRRRWGQIAVAATIGIALLIGVTTLRPASRGLRSHVRVMGTTPLFDGVTLSGWDVGGSMVGAWNTVEAPDSSTAIACTANQGALTRRFPSTPNPRISLFVWLQKHGGAVDIDFAFELANTSDVRGSLRISETSIQLGTKTSDFGDLAVTAETGALTTIHDRFHVVHIERQPDDWYVFLEDELIGTLPISDVGVGDAVRLVVHGSKQIRGAESRAYFADVQLSQLRPAESDKSPD